MLPTPHTLVIIVPLHTSQHNAGQTPPSPRQLDTTQQALRLPTWEVCPPATTWLQRPGAGRKRVRTKTQRHSSMMEKNREPDAIGDQQEREATAEGDTALPPSSLTRNDSSSFSVKLAVWARSHRSITRGSSNSAREQGVVCLGRSQGRTHPGAGGPHGLSARGNSVCVASWEH